MAYAVHSRIPSVSELEALANSGGTPATLSGTNKLATHNDSRMQLTGGASGGAMSSIFGNGSDGNVTFDGSAVTGWSLSGYVYTRTALNCPMYETINLSSNYELETAGRRLFAFELIAGSNCKITNNPEVPLPGDGTTTRGGAEPASVATSGAGAVFAGGGDAGRGVDSNFTTPGASAPQLAAIYLGGKGGRGGGATGAGQAAQITPARLLSSSNMHYYGDLWEILKMPYGKDTGGIRQFCGGHGGNSGAAINAGGTGTNQGYNGGGGGGVLVVGIKKMTCGTNFYFEAKGASPGNSQANSSGRVGGSAGGGGGAIVAYIGELTNASASVPVFDASGGNGSNASLTDTTVAVYAEGAGGGDGGKIQAYIGINYKVTTPTFNVNGGARGTTVLNSGATDPNITTNGISGTYSYKQGN